MSYRVLGCICARLTVLYSYWVPRSQWYIRSLNMTALRPPMRAPECRPESRLRWRSGVGRRRRPRRPATKRSERAEGQGAGGCGILICVLSDCDSGGHHEQVPSINMFSIAQPGVSILPHGRCSPQIADHRHRSSYGSSGFFSQGIADASAALLHARWTAWRPGYRITGGITAALRISDMSVPQELSNPTLDDMIDCEAGRT